MNSSGLFFTHNPDGSACIGYEDYNVETFNGSNYEVNYFFDETNFKLLLKHLNISIDDNIELSLIKEFGYFFNETKFTNICNKNNIKYKLYTNIN